MQRRIRSWLSSTLALLTACSVAANANGQAYLTTPASADAGYSTTGVSTSQDYYYASTSMGVDEAGLAARLADVEKALQKIDEKAKADKKKAAGKMSATPGGRIYIDTAAFGQDPVDKARWDEQNGVEFRAARLIDLCLANEPFHRGSLA